MIGLMWMDSGKPRVQVLRMASFEPIAGLVVWLPLGLMLSLVGVRRYVSAGVVWVASPVGGGWGTGARAGCCASVRVMWLMLHLRISLSIPRWLPFSSFVGVSKSVADVIRAIRHHGFTQTRWDALQRYWGAVCPQGPCGPVCTLELWVG